MKYLYSVAVAIKLVYSLVFIAFMVAILAGCGGGGGGDNPSYLGYRFGERLGQAVYMQPAPSAHTFQLWTVAGPDIRIVSVVQLNSTVHPAGSSIYSPATQVVYGQIAGSLTGKKVVVYSYTNGYYIQPLTATTINIKGDNTWIAPANPGTIHALLVKDSYVPLDAIQILPKPDGVNIFASTEK